MAGPDRALSVTEAEVSPLTAMVGVLDRALRRLGEAGRTDEACRLAAEAWALLGPAHDREARRLNGTLHYLAGARQETGR